MTDSNRLSSHIVTAQMGASRLIHREQTFYFEGSTDAEFYRALFKRKVPCWTLKGKEHVLDACAMENRDPSQADAEKYSVYCIDRDFDELLGLPEATDQNLVYQMCKEGRKGGFNDLECFVLSEKFMEYILDKYYGLSENQCAIIREEIIRAAAFTGMIRVHNRKNGNKLNYNRREINTIFMLENDLVKVQNQHLKINSENLRRVLQESMGRNWNDDCENIVMSIKKDWKNCSKNKYIDYCRGHDLVEYLNTILSQIKNPTAPQKKGIEGYFEESASAKADDHALKERCSIYKLLRLLSNATKTI